MRAMLAYHGGIRFSGQADDSDACRVAMQRDSQRTQLDDAPPIGDWQLAYEATRRARYDEVFRIWVTPPPEPAGKDRSMAESPAPMRPDTSSRALLKLAWPLFIANLAVVGNGTIDAVMAGRLSATDLAAVAVGVEHLHHRLHRLHGRVAGAVAHRRPSPRSAAVACHRRRRPAGTLAVSCCSPRPACRGCWRPTSGSDLRRVDGRRGAGSPRCTCRQSPSACPPTLATRVFVALNAAVSRPEGNDDHQRHGTGVESPPELWSSCTASVRFPPSVAPAPAWPRRCCHG